MKKIDIKVLDNKDMRLVLIGGIILVIVIGIVINSVLNSVNKNRGNSLEEIAVSIAELFNKKYKESLVGGIANDVLGDDNILGSGNGYNFQDSATYYLDKRLAKIFDISESDYAFANSSSSINNSAIKFKDDENVTSELVNDIEIENSIVSFDFFSEKFVVCMFANRNGSYWVNKYKVEKEQVGTNISSTRTKASLGTMYVCSDGIKSW